MSSLLTSSQSSSPSKYVKVRKTSTRYIFTEGSLQRKATIRPAVINAPGSLRQETEPEDGGVVGVGRFKPYRLFQAHTIERMLKIMAMQMVHRTMYHMSFGYCYATTTLVTIRG